MRGDFTRITYDRSRHFSSVRMQQGRVQIDADWNEQVAIQGQADRATRRDLIGPVGTPVDEAGVASGFRIQPTADGTNLIVGAGRYYVDGVLVENDRDVLVFPPQPSDGRPRQPFVRGSGGAALEPGIYLAYLHVFERHLTWLQEPSIREVALGGPDHGTRTQTCWQVALLFVDDADLPSGGGEGSGSSASPTVTCGAQIPAWDLLTTPPSASLAAQVTLGEDTDDPCIVPPSAGYRGPENQLYRVEVFRGGPAGTATFVWSRENGSVAAPWVGSDANQITLASPSQDSVLGFNNDDWVELSGDNLELADPNVADPQRLLVQMALVEGTELQLRTSTSGLGGAGSPSDADVDIAGFDGHPIVRRWDSPGQVTIPAAAGDWLELEDGIQVRFGSGPFVSGQYWLIPARTALRDVLWPRAAGVPALRPPAGVEHLYTRLGFVRVNDDGTFAEITDCRATFTPAALEDDAVSLLYLGGDGLSFRPGVVVGELRAGMYVGSVPRPGERVRFQVLEVTDGAFLADDPSASSGPLELDVETDAAGVARLWLTVTSWSIQTLRVRASRIGASDAAAPPPIHYRADRDAELVSCCCSLGSAPVGTALADPIEMRVVHRGHLACPAARVRIRLEGGGVLSRLDGTPLASADEIVTADADGRIALHWALGTAGEQSVVAELVDDAGGALGEPVCFTASLQRAQLTYLGGDGQSFSALNVLEALRTRVTVDGAGSPAVPVRYEVVSGSAGLGATSAGGTANALTVNTDADGVAQVWARPSQLASFSVRARRIDPQSSNPVEPHVAFNEQAGEARANPSRPHGRIHEVDFLDGNGAVVSTVKAARERVLWSDLALQLRVRGDDLRQELLSVPAIQVFVGWPFAADGELLIGHTWVRLLAEKESDRTDGAINWVPAKEVIEWVKRGMPGRVFGLTTLPGRIFLRGLLSWDIPAEPRPVPKEWVGDIDLEIEIELPGADPRRVASPGEAITTLEAQPASLSELVAGITVDGVRVRYDAARRHYVLLGRDNRGTPLTWSAGSDAYVASGTNGPIVVRGLPRIAR